MDEQSGIRRVYVQKKKHNSKNLNFLIPMQAAALRYWKFVAVFVLISAVAMITYLVFFQSNPESEAEKIAKSFCDCTNESLRNRLDANKKIEEEIQNKKISDRETYTKIIETANLDFNNKDLECSKMMENKVQEYKSKYESSPELVAMFEKILFPLLQQCQNSPNLAEENEKVHYKIMTLADEMFLTKPKTKDEPMLSKETFSEDMENPDDLEINFYEQLPNDNFQDVRDLSGYTLPPLVNNRNFYSLLKVNCDKSYFYSTPHLDAQLKPFCVSGQDVISVYPINGFTLVLYANDNNRGTFGWMRSDCLINPN